MWRAVDVGNTDVAVCQRAALGTVARVALWPLERLIPVLKPIDSELALLDRQASRFREGSEISRLHACGDVSVFVSEGLAEAVAVAIAAARWTDGLVDPTVGERLIELGYDRDFSMIARGAYSGVSSASTVTPSSGDPSARDKPVPGWRSVEQQGRLLRLRRGARVDLGATGKALGADRAAVAAIASFDGLGGVLVSLGGDIRVAGEPPIGGWPVVVTDLPDAGPVDRMYPAQQVRFCAGGLATSSTTRRTWTRDGRHLHHLIDPRTGCPARGPWRTASVAASTCAQANAASTAAIIAGEEAEQWLSSVGLPARLVAHDGSVRLIGSWPTGDDDLLEAPTGAGRFRVQFQRGAR
jgi:FAD:protein FMN transferase